VKDNLVAELGVSQEAAARILVLANAVEIPPRISAGRIAEIRNQLGCRPGHLVLLAAGRFCTQKNFRDLVPVAGRLREAGCRFRLVVAGEGELRSGFVAKAEESGLASLVTAPGNISDLDEMMQAADVFVMTSLWEGLPLVLLEAMAAGLPVVSYRIPGVEEVVQEQVTGLLAPVGDHHLLAEHLLDLAANEGERLAMGEAGRTRAETEYGFAEYLGTLVGRYEAAIAATPEARP
jgi:glycosyltransferase involved in cell wall biosynthesis